MKKIQLALSLFLFLFVLITPKVYAQDNTLEADDTDIERALEEAGVADEPEELEFKENTVLPGHPTGGYVDADGNPITKEEFDKLYEDIDKTDPMVYVVLAVIVLSIVGVTSFVTYSIAKKKNNATPSVSPMQQPVNPTVAQTPPAPQEVQQPQPQQLNPNENPTAPTTNTLPDDNHQV